MSLKMTYFLQSSALVSPHIFFINIKLPFWDIDGATPGELRHLCGHSQPDFGEMTEVVLSQQRSRRFKTQF